VGTITEIYDYLRLLYASVGTPHCPNCGRPISRQTSEQIVQRILELGKGERVTVMAPIVRGRKGEFKELLDQIDQQGFRAASTRSHRPLRAGPPRPAQEPHRRSGCRSHFAQSPSADPTPLPAGKQSVEKRLEQAVAKALQLANGLALVAVTGCEEQLFSSSMACPDCGLDVPKLEPRSFSFNSTFGACPECHGWARSTIWTPPRSSPTGPSRCWMAASGPAPLAVPAQAHSSGRDRYAIDLKLPFEDLPPRQQHILVYGPAKNEAPRTGFHGILSFLRDGIEAARRVIAST